MQAILQIRERSVSAVEGVEAKRENIPIRSCDYSDCSQRAKSRRLQGHIPSVVDVDQDLRLRGTGIDCVIDT